MKVKQPRIKLVNMFGNSTPVRVPDKMVQEIRKALGDRCKNGLTRKSLKDTDGFRLLMRTDGFRSGLEEIRRRPTWEGL